MTLPPSRIGDRGQRYIIETQGWPRENTDDWQAVAYSSTTDRLDDVVAGFKLHPCVTAARWRDRQT